MKDIISKFKFKSNAIVINSPQDLLQEFVNLGFDLKFDRNQKSKNTLIFVNNHHQFVDFLNLQMDLVESDSVLWFAYPKGSSGIKTDINRDIIRVKAEEFGITTVSAISINSIWSALRFRPIDRVGK